MNARPSVCGSVRPSFYSHAIAYSYNRAILQSQLCIVDCMQCLTYLWTLARGVYMNNNTEINSRERSHTISSISRQQSWGSQTRKKIFGGQPVPAQGSPFLFFETFKSHLVSWNLITSVNNKISCGCCLFEANLKALTTMLYLLYYHFISWWKC